MENQVVKQIQKKITHFWAKEGHICRRVVPPKELLTVKGSKRTNLLEGINVGQPFIAFDRTSAQPLQAGGSMWGSQCGFCVAKEFGYIWRDIIYQGGLY